MFIPFSFDRLRKRVKRKRMVREFGLLHKSRASALPRRHPFTNSSGAKYEHLFKMGPRIMCAFDFDFVLTGMENELGLRQQILRLQDYRNNGISHPLSAAFYSKLKSQREQDLIDRPKETILDYIRSAKTKAGHIKANPLMTMTTRRYVYIHTHTIVHGAILGSRTLVIDRTENTF